jgi:hypothetical protein
MKKALRVLAAASAVWAVTVIGGAAQAAPSTSHVQASAMSAQALDTGWG